MGRRKRDDPTVVGLLAVDKPQGLTSHGVVSRARRGLGVSRIGHSGTLDPMASGLLLLGCGWATRLLRFTDGLQKVYMADVTLGVETDTWDADGEIVEVRPVSVSPTMVAAALRGFVGKLEQLPPMYSAIKVGGEKLYDKARRGEDIVREPRSVEVYAIDLDVVDGPLVRFVIHASAGTYVRSVAHDLGAALGTGAHLSALRRTNIGPHDVAGAVTLDRVLDGSTDEARSLLAPPAEIVSHLPRVAVDDVTAAAVLSGRPMREVGPGTVAVVSGDGVLLAVYVDGRPGVVAPPMSLTAGSEGSGST